MKIYNTGDDVLPTSSLLISIKALLEKAQIVAI